MIKKFLKFILPSLFIVMAMVFGLYSLTKDFKKVHAIDVPTDYSISSSNVKNLEQNGEYNGITCIVPGVEYSINNQDGFISLARISQKDSLQGITFDVSCSALLNLQVLRNSEGNPVSDGSFFGIGSSSYPFKGNIVISGTASTYIAIKDWGYLFNNISASASITSDDEYKLVASNTLPFTFANKIDLTGCDGEFDISGYVNEITTYQNNTNISLFATSITGAGHSIIDLSEVYHSESYNISTTGGKASGLITSISQSSNVEIILNEFNANITGTGNSGLLVVDNSGTLSIQANTLSGSVSSPNAYVGLVTNNNAAATLNLESNIDIDLDCTGTYAGIISAVSTGIINIDTATLTGEIYGKTRAGGAVGLLSTTGDINVATSLIFKNTEISCSSISGGLIGEAKLSHTASFENIQFIDTKFVNLTGASDTGGVIGKITSTVGDIYISLSDSSFIYVDAIGTSVGGIVSNVAFANITQGLYIDNANMVSINNKFTFASSSAQVGGIVGKVDSKSYGFINNISVEDTFTNYTTNTSYEKIGEAVGNVVSGGALTIGNITYKRNGYASKLIGAIDSQNVVRFIGQLTDLSEKGNSIIYQRSNSLIYSDSDNFSISYAPVVENNDVGTWGQIIRNENLGSFISFNETTHKVEFNSKLAYNSSTKTFNITSVEDFAKLVVYYTGEGYFIPIQGLSSKSTYIENITLSADIDLRNTGLESLFRSNNVSQVYKGVFDGGEHSITLAIGENANGENVGVRSTAASANNYHQYLGLFTTIKNATIKNLTIEGNISLNGVANTFRVGGGVAYVSDSNADVTFDNCTTNLVITDNSAGTKDQSYIGGFSGKTTCRKLVAKNCVSNLVGTSSSSSAFICGFFARAEFSSSCDISNSTVSANIYYSDSITAALNAGCFSGVFDYTGSDIIEVNTAGFKIVNSSIYYGNATTIGGLFSYRIKNCSFTYDDEIKNCSLTAKSATKIGGFAYELVGRLDLGPNVKFDNCTITGASSVEGGIFAYKSNEGYIIAEFDPSAYDGITYPNHSKFDLFARENVTTRDGTTNVGYMGGFVTIETGDPIGMIPEESDWFEIIKNNALSYKSKYYFNVKGLENYNYTGKNCEEKDLIYFNLRNYCHSSIRRKYYNKNVSSFAANKDFDMTDYCFYPSDVPSASFNFNGHTFRFGNPSLSTELTTSHFLGINTSFIRNAIATSDTCQLSIANVIFTGTFHCIGTKPTGIFVTNMVSGYLDANGSKVYMKLNAENIFFDNLLPDINDNGGSKSLFIYNIDSYVKGTISSVSHYTRESYHLPEEQKVNTYTRTGIYSALIGKCGADAGTSNSTYVVFKDIVLEAVKTKSIFVSSTLVTKINLNPNNSKFIYNFNYAEDWNGTTHLRNCTYGLELYTNENQHLYYDSMTLYVSPTNNNLTSLEKTFSSGYLPYTSNSDTRDRTWVNIKNADISDGYGTYANPYIITNPSQLTLISNIISGNATLNDNWRINYPRVVGSVLDLENYTEYTYMNDSLINSSSQTLTEEKLREYLQGAYYLINVDSLKMTNEFGGLGTQEHPFHGVVVGKDSGCIIEMAANNSITNDGYGLINVANGCAIYNIDISYAGNIKLDANKYNATTVSTSGPTSYDNHTTAAHFGGAIAWIVGGDNYLVDVNVSITGTVTKGGSYSVFGGYVGLISGGGVVFDQVGAGYSEFETDEVEYKFYNPYIGRVINGYGFAIDSKDYNNGTIEYTIPNIAKNTSRSKINYSSSTITLNNAEDLLILSFGLDSGAFVSDNPNYVSYGSNYQTRNRIGDYSEVGNVSSISLTNGAYVTDAYLLPYICGYFQGSDTTTMENEKIKIVFTSSTYDVSPYKNGFRGLGGKYISSISYNFESLVGVESKTKIILDNQYSNRAYMTGSKLDTYLVEPDLVVRNGFVPQIKNEDGTIFKNLTISGNVSIVNYVDVNVDYKYRIGNDNTILLTSSNLNYAVGGFAGAGSATFKNASIEDLNVFSSDIAGGLIGLAKIGGSGNVTIIDEVVILNSEIRGIRYSVGCYGFVSFDNTVNVIVNDLTIDSSLIDNRFSGWITSTYGGSAGIFAYTEGGGDFTYSNIKLLSTAILTESYELVSNSNTYIFSAGLVGKVNNPSTFNDIVVDSSSNSGYLSETPDSTRYLADYSTYYSNYKIDDPCYNGLKNIAGYILSRNTSTMSICGSIFVGYAYKNVTVNGFTLTTDNYATVIAGGNNTAILFGQGSSANYYINDFNVVATNHDIILVGQQRSAGIVGYTSSGNFYIDGAHYSSPSGKKIILTSSSYTSALCSAPTILEVRNASIEGVTMVGTYVGAVASTIQGKTTVEDTKVENCLLYGRSNYTGGLFGNIASNAGVYVNNCIFENNVIESSNYAGGIVGYVNGAYTVNINYVLMENNIIGKRSATSILNSAYYTAESRRSQNLSNLSCGYVVGYNKGTVNAIGISRKETLSNVFKGEAYGTNLSTVNVANLGYGAVDVYHDSLDAISPEDAILSLYYIYNNDKGYFYGDSVTSTDSVFTPIDIASQEWKVYRYDINPSIDSLVTTLGDVVPGIPMNGDLQLFYVNGKLDSVVTEYINSLLDFDIKSIAPTMFKIASNRYTLNDETGAIAKTSKEGSISYSGGVFVANAYDNLLTGDTHTFTVLTITFTNKKDASTNSTYTLSIPVYYPQILDLETHVIPLESEVYQLTSFIYDGASNFSLVAGGDDFTLYIEYSYNDVANNIEDYNFAKYIWSTKGDFASNGTKLPAGTKFILIDLNSETTAGYKVVYYTSSSDLYEIHFNDFSSINGNSYTGCHFDLDELIKYTNHVNKNNYVSERYLLVVDLPDDMDSTVEKAYQYNFKAMVEENDRNIIVEENISSEAARVDVWKEPEISIDTIQNGSSTFSNDNRIISETINTEVNFPKDYIKTVMGNITMNGVYSFTIKDSTGKSVTMPKGSIANIYDSEGNLIISEEVSGLRTITYSLHDIISKTNPISDKFTSQIRFELDFSKVDNSFFKESFENKGKYNVLSSFYYVSDENYYFSGKFDSDQSLYEAIIASNVKVTVQAIDTKTIGINVNNIEKTDKTNLGQIEFVVIGDFKTITENSPINAKFEFALYEKKYNSTTGEHYYDDSEDLLGTLGDVKLDGAIVTSANIEIVDGVANQVFVLSLKLRDDAGELLPSVDLTNYQLVVKVTGLNNDGDLITSTESNYFIFLITDIYTELP